MGSSHRPSTIRLCGVVEIQFYIPMHSSALSVIRLSYSNSLQRKGLACFCFSSRYSSSNFTAGAIRVSAGHAGCTISSVSCAKKHRCMIPQSHVSASSSWVRRWTGASHVDFRLRAGLVAILLTAVPLAYGTFVPPADHGSGSLKRQHDRGFGVKQRLRFDPQDSASSQETWNASKG